MKRSNTKFETSITCSTETRDTLKKIKDINEYKTYEETLTELLSAKQGIIDDKTFEVVRRPQIALTITSSNLNNDGTVDNTTLLDTAIYFNDLQESDIGKQYNAPKPNGDDYTRQVAVIVYKTVDFVLLQVKSEVRYDGQVHCFTDLVGVELL